MSYPQDQNDSKDLLDEFKNISRSNKTDNKNKINKIFGGKATCDNRFFVMDDVSGLADESKKFFTTCSKI